MNVTKTQSKVLSRVRLVVLAAGLCTGIAACEEKDVSADALQKANITLASLSPFGTPAASTKFKSQTYSAVITSLQSVSREGSASQKAAASLLIAQSQAGLAEPAASRAGELERAALNSLSSIRSRQSQFLTQSSNAAAAMSYDPSKEVAAIEQSDKEKDQEIKAEQAKRDVIDKKVAGLKAQAQAKADQARAMQQEAGSLHQKIPNQTATEGEKTLIKAREIARRADALEVESASLEAEAAHTAPGAMEGQNSIERLTKQRDLLSKERGEVSKRTQAAKDLAGAMRADAAKTADEIKQAVTKIEELRAGDLKAATDEAIKGYTQSASGAKSAASEMKSTAQMTIGSANQSLADVYLARAEGLQAFTQVLDSLATAKPALPDAGAYKSKADETRAAAKEAVETAREAYKTADAAYNAAGATGEAKTRLEKLNHRLRDLVKATGGDQDMIPPRGEVVPEVPPPETAPPAATAASGTPQETLQALIDIEKTGSFETSEPYFLAANEAEKQALKALIELQVRSKKLDAAVKAKFGASLEEISKELGGGSRGFDLAGLKSAADVPVTVEGASATATPPSGKPFKMKQVNGKWLVEMSAFGIPPEMLGMVPALMGPMGKAMEDMAADVTAGKYADRQAFVQALKQKMMQTMPPPGGG